MEGSRGPKRTLRGDDARRLIQDQITAHSGGLRAALRPYEPRSAVRAWHDTIHAIEEFINIPLFVVDDEAAVRSLLSVRLDAAFLLDPGESLRRIRQTLTPHVEAPAVERFCRLVLQLAAISSAFAMHGQSSFGPGITLRTVGDALEYLQSRRRHFVALLYFMPVACCGTRKLEPIDTLNVLLPQVEHSCTTITGLHLKLALLDALAEFSLEVDDQGALASHWLQTLDAGFLDPERVSIMAMNEFRGGQISVPALEPADPMKAFSAAELRNNIKLLGATYEAFGLNDSEFATMAAVIASLSHRCRDDYVVAIAKPQLRTLLRTCGGVHADELDRLLVNQPDDTYASSTNAFEPFINVGDAVVSNVNLLSRFLYAFKNVHLGSRRHFQIHAGFIFEDMVKRDLERLGFTVTDVKRINRKEFDVVATHADVIYNFQCKNNWIDLAKAESNRTLYVRYNRALANYYSKSLAKEEKREGLLKDRLGLNAVEHRLISRFPVIATDERIVNYNRINDLAVLLERAQAGSTDDKS